ncbi:MAG: precorrin-6y C5,15-methyltransferase (decarboxylating) subunit CbiE [Reyranella sp.]|uniref:precorrin-6y C5,15-methyltransferase (decarboxylating) subunit CbiE n=1 Tax=Reyranella sp. TaxID=1929291 RepID=UPI001214A802|nr:precorrin-6y C5,15-methyltransferase (decarboxylating) subunit CbiE [Reyranella sp.]TAJ91910.1 MAG: precorrin-6y C5,15-methyltransferase (decarboxylating) subunit CbiE [Reyranella sp.]TBR29325.1 MAG: precorrin-6y C5,15-methyltransferase (decarboxylating) subunit CbiE [Reyranella sp.]
MAEPRHCMTGRWLSIIGIGEDGIDGLSPVARRLVADARLVIGGARHLELAQDLATGRQMPWPSPIAGALTEIEAHRGQPVAILASGDPFHFGVGDMLMRRFDAEEMLCHPAPSAFSLSAARLGWSLQGVATVSLHGRPLAGIVRHLQPGARVIALAWDGQTPGALARLLTERGLGKTSMTVLERLGGPEERVRRATAKGFDLAGVDALNTIALDIVVSPGATIVGLSPGLDDGLFENDGQLTKREIRAVTIAALAPRHGELLWDVGLGAGSVAIEWLLRHPSLRAIGIEASADRAARAARNATQLGTPDLEIVEGRAPNALRGLAAPDAVFIGGGLSDEATFETAWAALKPGGRLVANAVSLASQARLIDLFGRHGGEIVRLDVARAGTAGAGTVFVWRPAAPIVQWRVSKP